jgi:DNA-binding MarR family transcriptional regulator
MPFQQMQELVDELVKLMPVILRRVKPDPAFVADCPSGTLAYSEMRILLHLAIYGDSGSSAVAEAIGMSRPAVTEAIDRLVTKEFVERAGHEGDRRRVNVRLTPRATDFAERILARWRDGFTRSLSRLDSAEQVGFLKGMKALADSLLEISQEETAARETRLESTTEVLRS